MITPKFKEQIKDIMCEDYPDNIAVIKSEEFDQTLDYLISAAQSYGFLNEIHISIFVLTAWILGIDFDKNYSVINKKLLDKDLTNNQKIEWLEIYTDILLNDENKNS